MNFHEILFLIHLILTIGSTGVALYNVVHKGEKFSLPVSFGLFIVYLFGWFFGLMVTMTEPSILFGQLLKMNSAFMVINIACLIFVILFNLAKPPESIRQRYSRSSRFS